MFSAKSWHGVEKKSFSEPFSTDIPVQMYYGNLVLGKRLSGKLYGAREAPFNEQTKVTDSAVSAQPATQPTGRSAGEPAGVEYRPEPPMLPPVPHG